MAKGVWADKVEECYRRAADARRLSEAAADPSTKSEFLEIEQRWLYLARSAMGPIPMLIAEDYEQLAERCAKLANASSEPTVADALSALAADYFERAERLHTRKNSRLIARRDQK
jgi:hypothetical protein